jgi:hypothetical protein
MLVTHELPSKQQAGFIESYRKDVGGDEFKARSI